MRLKGGLAHTSMLNGAAVATRLATALALNKVLAVYVGPAGFGVIGQFQSLVAMLGALAGGAFSSGVTKLTAQHGGDPVQQLAVWRTAATLCLIAATTATAVLLLAGRPLADWLLGDPTLGGVMVWLALGLVGISLNGLLLAALAGMKAVRAFVAANIAGSLLSAAVAITLVVQAGLYGALIAAAIGQAVACVASVAVFRRVWNGPWRSLVGRIERKSARALGGFALMAAASAVVLPISHIAIRDGLTQLGGAELAGLWQAMFKLSDTHLLLLTTTLSLHFLPHFSEIGNGAVLRTAVAKGYRFVLPLVCATALAIWLLRAPLVHLLFTSEFQPLTEALAWQLLGDVLKVGSWVPAFTMISHARTRLFLASEVVFGLVLTVACLAFAARFGLTGAAIGYAVTYAIYWVFVHHQLGRLTARLVPAPVMTAGHAGP